MSPVYLKHFVVQKCLDNQNYEQGPVIYIIDINLITLVITLFVLWFLFKYSLGVIRAMNTSVPLFFGF